MTILLTFQTHEGQTEKIATRLAFDLIQQGFQFDLVDIGHASAPDGFEAVVIGAPVRFGRHNRRITRYLHRHRDQLAQIPVALFQVSMTSARGDEEHVAKADQLARRLVDGTGITPDLVAKFAGALRYSQYGWVTKRVMRSIARRKGNDTDTSRDHEYTDWVQVDSFAREVGAVVRNRSASSSAGGAT